MGGIVLKLNAGKACCNLLWLLLFYRTGIIKLICDKDQYPGKLDPFVQVEATGGSMGQYVSGV